MVETTEEGVSAPGHVDAEDSPFPLTETDRWVLSQKDEDFHLHDWDELRHIIG